MSAPRSRMLAKHGLGDARELRRHLGVRLHRLGAHDHAGGAGVEVAPDEIAIRWLTKDRDRQPGGVAPGVLGEPVERDAAFANLLRRDAVGQPAIAPRDYALEHIGGAAAQQHWRVWRLPPPPGRLPPG